MPCRGPEPTHNNSAALEKEIHKLTDLLCKTFRAIKSEKNPFDIEEIELWWNAHTYLDTERMHKELATKYSDYEIEIIKQLVKDKQL